LSTPINPRQTVIESALPRLSPLDEAMAVVREAKAAEKKAKEAREHAEGILLARMLELEVPRYDYVDADGGQWSLALSLPEQPGLRIKYLGKYEDE
jgi:hypothetical protein